MPAAQPRDTKLPRVLLLLVNDSPNLLVPKAKPRNANNICYYYFYSANVPNHLLMIGNYKYLTKCCRAEGRNKCVNIAMLPMLM